MVSRFWVFLLLALALAGCGGGDQKVVRGPGGATLKVAWSRQFVSPARQAGSLYRDPGRAQLDLVIDSSHNVYLLDRFAVKSGDQGFALRKYTPGGRLDWTVRKTRPWAERLRPQAVALDSADNVWVLTTADLPQRAIGVHMQKYSPKGRRLAYGWRSAKPKPMKGIGFMLAGDNRGGMYAAGTVAASPQYNWVRNKPWVARYGPDAKLIWERFPVPPESRGRAKGLTVAKGIVTLAAAGDTAITTKPFDGGRILDKVTDYNQWTSYNAKGDLTAQKLRNFKLPDLLPRIPAAQATGPTGHTYSVPADGLDVWLEIKKGRAVVVRAAVVHAKEVSSTRLFQAWRLITDKEGNAYLVVIEERTYPRRPVVHLYKLEISLP